MAVQKCTEFYGSFPLSELFRCEILHWYKLRCSISEIQCACGINSNKHLNMSKNALFLVAPCCSQGATLHVTLRCHPKFFFTSFHFFMHFWMFHAILSAQKKFHPKFFWVKQGATQCYEAFLVFPTVHENKKCDSSTTDANCAAVALSMAKYNAIFRL